MSPGPQPTPGRPRAADRTVKDPDRRPLGWLFPPVELPDDLTAAGYRQRSRALLQKAETWGHAAQADRIVAAAHVYALCALSAVPDEDT